MAESSQVPFVRELAANDRPTRDKAVTSLRGFLSARRKITDLELLKLWKGLFYCVWMSDRALTQQRLVADLAGLVDVLPVENVESFLDAFWRTMAREWDGIESLRMDKFLLLVRAYLGASFRHLRKTSWDPAAISSHKSVLEATPFNPNDVKVPNGLRYHVIDIYVDEIDKSDQPRGGNIPLQDLLSPLKSMLGSPVKTVRLRAKAALNDERIEDWDGLGTKGETENQSDDEQDDWNGFEK